MKSGGKSGDGLSVWKPEWCDLCGLTHDRLTSGCKFFSIQMTQFIICSFFLQEQTLIFTHTVPDQRLPAHGSYPPKHYPSLSPTQKKASSIFLFFLVKHNEEQKIEEKLKKPKYKIIASDKSD